MSSEQDMGSCRCLICTAGSWANWKTSRDLRLCLDYVLKDGEFQAVTAGRLEDEGTTSSHVLSMEETSSDDT